MTRAVAEGWDLQAVLQACNQPRYQDRIIARMWVYHRDLELAGDAYASAKTDFERALGKDIVRIREAGERSAEVAERKSLAENDAVYGRKLQYRTAEQRVAADKAALNILHAQLEDLRTQAADARAADQFQARTGT